MVPKQWYQSRMLWVAVFTVAAGVLSAFGIDQTALDPSLKPMVDAAVLILVGIVNFILRLRTNQAIR